MKSYSVVAHSMKSILNYRGFIVNSVSINAIVRKKLYDQVNCFILIFLQDCFKVTLRKVINYQ